MQSNTTIYTNGSSRTKTIFDLSYSIREDVKYGTNLIPATNPNILFASMRPERQRQ